jgi:hypothetical protein
LNGIGTQNWQGNSYSTCAIQTCNLSFHIENNQCLPDVKSCPIVNGEGTQTWNVVNQNYDACLASSCNSSELHIENNQCLPNVKACVVSNGEGTQTWNPVNQNYDACVISSCNTDYFLSVEDNTCKSTLTDLVLVGSVKQSLLTVSEFQALNGNCWVLMQGQSIAGSDLANAGVASLPDTRGQFLRVSGGQAGAVGVIQAESIIAHKHPQRDRGPNGANSQYSDADGTVSLGSRNTYVRDNSSGSRIRPYSLNAGSVETRPINLSINNFIKINNNCGGL